MSRPPPDREADVPLRARAADPRDIPARPPLPFFHHPVIALSLVVVAACAAQITVSLVNVRLTTGPMPDTAGPAVHGYLFEPLRAYALSGANDEWPAKALFIACAACSLLSAPAWYLFARFGIGPAWAFWTAMLWVIHPDFAFLVQRPGPLALLMLLTPVCLACLARWRTTTRRWLALAAGAVLGLTALVGAQSIPLLAGVVAAVLCARLPRVRRFQASGLLCAGFLLTAAGGVMCLRSAIAPTQFASQIREDLRVSLDDGASPIARAARDNDGQLFLGPFLARQLGESPGTTLRWFGRRLTRGFYATADGKLQRPLFAVQFILLVPALWGGVVALRHPPWRWTAGLCAIFIVTFWLSAGLLEPLARNLVPAGGSVVLLALIGLGDIYERLFGRRLTGPDPSQKTVARRRGADYNLT